MKYDIQKLENLKKGNLPSVLVVLLSEAQIKAGKEWKLFPGSLPQMIEKVLTRKGDSAKKKESLIRVQGVAHEEPDLILAVLPEKPSAYQALTFAKTAIKEAQVQEHERLGVVFLEGKETALFEEAMGAVIAAANFKGPTYGKRTKDQKPSKLKQVIGFGKGLDENRFRSGWVSGEGTNLVRYLGLLPPNELNPSKYGKKIRELAEQHDLGIKFYSISELKKMGAGAFCAVDRANPKSDGGIYELTYEPKKARHSKWIALVGKGMCFDTGGYDVKTQGFMVTMKGDMQGSAVALATLIAAARLSLPLKLKAYLAVTENHLSPEAYHADEVVHALNGMSIEVVDSDAEGRMVLSDTLTLASRIQPSLIMDFATLTGSAVRAIGNTYAAGFSNREELHSKMIAAGKKSGERVWPFPFDADHGKALESDVADLLQCSKGKGPDHIYAAYFLSQFVEKGLDWIHIDLAPSEREGGLAHTDTTFTGFGVRFALEYLKQNFLRG